MPVGITMLKDNAEGLDTSKGQEPTGLTVQGSRQTRAEANLGISTDNPHVWLDPQLYISQIDNVKDGLLNYLSSSNRIADTAKDKLKQEITNNSQAYISEVEKLNADLTDITGSLPVFSDQSAALPQAVIFHDAFAYLADRAGLKVGFTVPLDSDTSLSAGDIASIIDAVKRDNIKYLFTPKQYSDSIAKQIEAETDAKVYIIDSVVTGPGTKDAYLKAMQGNLKVLKEVLKNK
jgi:zinc transport system substrate-binding protein